MNRLIVGSWVVSAAAVVGVSQSIAATPTRSSLSAQLSAAKVVPAPEVAAPRASGRFTGTLTYTFNDGWQLKWRVTYARLTSRPLVAQIRLGAKGKSGRILIVLCSRCTSGVRGKSGATATAARAILSGRAYVNLATAKNPNGELRGQIIAREA